eukprot:TRINITY_DN16393_c0_g1_i1.p1 TRINITY_DN16393_c0_g1~~TRINITY_DN16393_c0_g1_i1.p1  ORF type:complete len:738 (+),score=115.43 TRINITY_DN16393_c0_g1_i1:34-2247(+)
MSLADEVNKLKALLDDGILNLAQFEDAKNAVIKSFASPPSVEEPRHAADEYVIHLFWDVSNCPMSECDKIAPILHEIKHNLKKKFSKECHGWDPFASVTRGQFYLNAKVSHGLMSSQIDDLRDVGLTHVDPGEKRGGDDHKMISDITQLATDPTIDSSKVVVVVITGDRDFSASLRTLKSNGFAKTLLIHNGSARKAFLSNAMFALDWNYIRSAAIEAKLSINGNGGSSRTYTGLYRPSEQRCSSKHRKRSASPAVRAISRHESPDSAVPIVTGILKRGVPHTPLTPVTGSRPGTPRTFGTPGTTPPRTPPRSPTSRDSFGSKGQAALEMLKQASVKSSRNASEYPLFSWLSTGEGIGVEKAAETMVILHKSVLDTCGSIDHGDSGAMTIGNKTSAAFAYNYFIMVNIEPLIYTIGMGLPSYKVANLMSDLFVAHDKVVEQLAKCDVSRVVCPFPFSMKHDRDLDTISPEVRSRCIMVRSAAFASASGLTRELLTRHGLGEISTLPIDEPEEFRVQVVVREVLKLCTTHPETIKNFAASLMTVSRQYGPSQVLEAVADVNDFNCFAVAGLLSHGYPVLGTEQGSLMLTIKVLEGCSSDSSKKVSACLQLLDSVGERLDESVEGIIAVDGALDALLEKSFMNKLTHSQQWLMARIRKLRSNGWREKGGEVLNKVSAPKLKSEIKDLFHNFKRQDLLKKLVREQYKECLVNSKLQYNKLTYGRAHALLRELKKLQYSDK